jgi:GT2 family glycosyltransferase
MVHILLPVHNRAVVTAAFAAALAGQDHDDYRLILIDDGCTDNTVDLVKRLIPSQRLCVLSGDGGLWWAGALQLGYEFLQYQPLTDEDTVLIVNDDISIESDFLSNGLTALAKHPGSAIQAIGYDQKTGTVDRGALANLWVLRFNAATTEKPANCLSTRGLIMRAPIFKKSGGFRPKLLPHYMSDYEFTLRLRRQGVQLRCDDSFKAIVRLELTGCGQYRRDGFSVFLTEAFSNRAKYNPKQMSAFVLLTCSPWIVPLHLIRIWLRFGISAFRAFSGNAKP